MNRLIKIMFVVSYFVAQGVIPFVFGILTFLSVFDKYGFGFGIILMMCTMEGASRIMKVIIYPFNPFKDKLTEASK